MSEISLLPKITDDLSWDSLCAGRLCDYGIDRAGAIASPPFDINKDGLQLVSVILGYL